MATDSRRQQVLEEFRRRLELVEIANNFLTDAGKATHLGSAPELSSDDPDVAIAILARDEEVQYQGANLLVTFPIEIQALAKADLDEPWRAVEAVITDIKRAVELDDRTLGGLVRRMISRVTVRTLPRQPGSTTVGASLIYAAPYVEAWGNP